MKTFTSFDEALACFRLWGGAMSFELEHYPTETSTWAVGTTEEVNEISTVDPRTATEHALFAGGMTPRAIEVELADWTP